MALKVVTWNVENFFQPGAEAGPETPQQYEEKRQALAAVLGHIDADVVALQELGGPEELTGNT